MPSRNRVNAGSMARRAAGSEPEQDAPAEPANGAPGRRPKLGQNFLTDRGAAERIVAALGDISQATVLEIGPGRGALTSLLAPKANQLIAVELDRVLAAQLRMKYTLRENVEIIEGDILKIDLATLLTKRSYPLAGLAPAAPRPARAVGNIPYYITSGILLHLLAFHAYFETIVLLVQHEVAERIAAQPGHREYGLLSATVQLHARVEKLFTLPPGAFFPPPKVQSTALRLTMAPQMERLRVAEPAFVDFLKLSFGQKRKTLANNLKSSYGQEEISHALSKAGVRRDVRAEALPLDKAAAIFRLLAGKGLS